AGLGLAPTARKAAGLASSTLGPPPSNLTTFTHCRVASLQKTPSEPKGAALLSATPGMTSEAMGPPHGPLRAAYRERVDWGWSLPALASIRQCSSFVRQPLASE